MISVFQIPRKPLEGEMGICRICLGSTEVLHPCCDGEVEYNSIIFTKEDFEGEK